MRDQSIARSLTLTENIGAIGGNRTRNHSIETVKAIFLFPFWLPLEHGASMKLPVSLQFLNLGQSVGLLERVISSSQELYLRRTTET
jgi:hypothetical protein